ncbi:calcium/proton exchanger [Marasmius fiardii PR-910]|nr:calcium/proton exchanger [Marasmius fiardii PR-910]
MTSIDVSAQEGPVQAFPLSDIIKGPKEDSSTVPTANPGSSHSLESEQARPTQLQRLWDVLGVQSSTQKLIWLGILVLTPLSWALHFGIPDNSTAIFVFAFLALIPQSQVLGYYTEQLSLCSGEKVAALLNASLGNAVELIVAIIALTKCELEVTQASLIGSVVSNILLVTGIAMFVGGIRNGEQAFSGSDAQLQSALLAVAFSSVVFPTIFYIIETEKVPGGSETTMDKRQEHLLALSRGTALILILVYGTYIWYNMVSARNTVDVERGTREEEEKEEEEEVKVNPKIAVGLLIFVTALIGVTAEFLVSSINGLVANSPLSKQFVSLILLPIAGNAAEHASAIMLSWKNKMGMALEIAIGSSIQISIFVLPFMVILSWIMGKPLTLYFDLLQTIVFVVTVMIVHYIVQDGKSVWMEGVILFALYVILCVAFQVYPGSDAAGLINSCR